ncbi:MAG TPA: hypothetical protein VMT46_15810 [Anaerolineaceae bacterium]|nr:hypothetical protein [Anaerolineaceae bacterium]
MEFVPYRLLRNQPNELRKRLEEQGELVVTVDGEPLAVMLQIPKGSLEDLVFLVSQVRAQLAVGEIREEARKSGRNRMSSKEIDALIKETRTHRRANRSA